MSLGAIKTIQVKFCESRLKMGREKEKEEYLRFWSNYSKTGNGRRPATTHPLRFKSFWLFLGRSLLSYNVKILLKKII